MYQKSDYLDNLDVFDGSVVICKASIGCDFTPGQEYVVKIIGTIVYLLSDYSDMVIPSARFYPKLFRTAPAASARGEAVAGEAPAGPTRSATGAKRPRSTSRVP